MTVVEHGLLAVAVTALAGTGWRLAGHLTTYPLERALVAATGATCGAVVHALLLGRLGLGGSTAALVGAALATYVGARLGVRSVTGARWWPRLTQGERAGVLAALGGLAALTAWLLAHPAIGIDAAAYHLPEAIGWVQQGDTGSTPLVIAEFQTGSYPLAHETVLAWGMGIAHSFAPAALWMGTALALLALALWTGLRRLGCSHVVTALAVAAVLAEPVLTEHLGKPKNDLPAAAWLAVSAALCVAAVPWNGALARPLLLGPALAAAGLAIGTKTTVAPLALVVLLAAFWSCREVLRPARVAVGAGLVAAGAVGGVWYVRNLIAHGWFFWPFSSGPFGGDPVPIYLERIDVSFLERPRASVAGRAKDYVDLLAGGLVLMAGGVLAGLARPGSRLVVSAAAATALAAVAWTAAPFTGRSSDPVLDLSITTVRYLLPVMVAGAVALALWARTSRLAVGLLGLALSWNVMRTVSFGSPELPGAHILVLGSALGAIAALAADRLTRGPQALAAIAAVGAVLFAAHAADGWLRHAGEADDMPASPVLEYFAGLPGWNQDRTPVAFVSQVLGPLAGDRLRHPIELIPGDEPCTVTRKRVEQGWVVMRDIPPVFRALLAPVRAPECLEGLVPIARPGEWLVYSGTRGRPGDGEPEP